MAVVYGSDLKLKTVQYAHTSPADYAIPDGH